MRGKVPSLLAIGKQATSSDVDRGMAAAVGLLAVFGAPWASSKRKNMAEIRVKRRHLFEMSPEYQRKAVVNGSSPETPAMRNLESRCSHSDPYPLSTDRDL